MKKLIFLSFTIFLCALSAKSQPGVVDGSFGYYQDALLFGRTQSIGTARTQAIGGAQAALGGDVNSAYANPAGLGFNRSSVVTFTPSLNFFESDTEYFGTTTPDFKTNLNFANLGVVFNLSNSDIQTSKFKGGSFAITLTRENNFHRDYNYDGVNSSQPADRSSIVESWIDQAWGIHPDDLTGLPYTAFNQYLINDYNYVDEEGNTGIGYGQFVGSNPRQSEVNQVSGRQYQWDFAYGGNYDDILYFGAGLNISSIKNKTESKYTESEFDNNSNLSSLTLNNTLDLRGTGVSASAGLIARPSDYFRVGISVVSPTYYEMTEESTMDLETIYTVNEGSFTDLSGNDIVIPFDDNSYYDEFDPAVSNYTLKTPGKLTLGGAFFLGKIGFVSADVDFVNYAGSRLKSNDFSVTSDNQTIDNIYQNTKNFRVGTEIRLDVFRLRGGYSYQGDPYSSDLLDGSTQQFSGGIGYRNKQYFVDLSATHSTVDSQRSPYSIASLDGNSTDLSPIAYTENRNLNLALTVGFNF